MHITTQVFLLSVLYNSLKGYSQYQKERVKDYLQAGYKLAEIDMGKVKKCYEIYCKSAYNSYKIELEQDNPGFIL